MLTALWILSTLHTLLRLRFSIHLHSQHFDVEFRTEIFLSTSGAPKGS